LVAPLSGDVLIALHRAARDGGRGDNQCQEMPCDAFAAPSPEGNGTFRPNAYSAMRSR
jgi:hypothetical protein